VRTPLSTVEKLIAPANASIIIGAQAGPVLARGRGALGARTSERDRRARSRRRIGAVVVKRTRGIEFTRTQQAPSRSSPAISAWRTKRSRSSRSSGPPEDGHGAADVPEIVRASGHMTRAVLAAKAVRRATRRSCARADPEERGQGLDRRRRSFGRRRAIDSGAAGAVIERLRALA